MSRLRSVLEPGRKSRGESSVLLTKEPGYLLAVDPEQVDYLRFERNLEEARSRVDSDADEAVVLLGAALAEWNGDPFADFAYEAFARNDIARLEELRLEALELRFDAQLSRGQTTELVAALQTFVRENPYRERPVGQLMVALYRAGRQAEALRAFERHRRVLGEELGVDPSPELRLLEEQILLHDQRLKPRTSEPRFRLSEGQIHVNPYQGLHAFRESDQGQFFGREPLVAELLRRLGRGGRLVALVGPSGSGKSSVVHAGLIPKVRKEALEGEWLVATMVPGAHPFTELEAALLRSRLDAPDSLSDQLATGDQAILRAGLRVLPDDGARLLIVIDQFEELFTLVEDREEERRFLDALLVAVDDPHGRVRVVLTLRADFYDRPLLHPRFGSRLGDAVVNVTPLDAQELEEAAVHPAAATGVRIEPTLLARLLADVVDQPGALPMFQYTLTDLYEQRDGDVMVESAYNEMGGVRGAITHRAEELFLDIGPEEQAAARQLFLRLVAMSDGETWSRRRVKASEIISLDVDVVALQAVLDRFGTHRLLLFDRDRVSGSPTVEVGHEALLSEWDRLEDWINDARQDLVRHRSFAASVDEWERSGRDPDYLVSGSRLAEYERWASGSAIELNARELDYLGASLDRRTAEVAAAEEQAAREAALEGSAKRRLWGLAAAVAVLVGLAAAVAFTAFGSDPPRVALVDANAGLTKQGLDEAARRFDIEAVSVTPPWVSPEAVGEELAESGTELIVMTGFDADVAEDLALRFPDTTFVVPFDPFDSDAPNYVRYRFAHEEGGYLAGIAAASTSATGVIGFIGAFELTETYHSLAGFQSGAWSVNPDLRIEVRFAFGPPSPSNFERPAVGYEVAREMFARGVDVIYHHAENTGLGIFRAARDASEGDGALRRWGIGSFSDQYVQLDPADRDYLLMSVVRRLDTVVLDATERLLTGQLTEPEVTLTMADEGFGYLDSGGKLPAALVDTLDGAMASITAGDIDVPSEPWVALQTNGLERDLGDARFGLAAGGNLLTIASSPFSGDLRDHSDGVMTGFGAELIEEAASRLGLQVAHVEAFLPEILEGVETGQLDMGMCDCDVTPEREARFWFTPPWRRNTIVLVALDDSPVESIDDVTSVVVSPRTSAEELVRAEYPELTVVSSFGPDKVEILQRGQADAWIADSHGLPPEVKIVEELWDVEQAFPIHRGLSELSAAMDRVMTEMLTDGTYAAMYERWFDDLESRIDVG